MLGNRDSAIDDLADEAWMSLFAVEDEIGDAWVCRSASSDRMGLDGLSDILVDLANIDSLWRNNGGVVDQIRDERIQRAGGNLDGLSAVHNHRTIRGSAVPDGVSNDWNINTSGDVDQS